MTMGGVLTILKHSFGPKPTWTSANIPDLSSKIFLVTGGNSGIGFETTKSLLEHNARVYILSREPERAKKAIEELKEITGKTAEYIQCDLGDLASIRRAAEEFKSKEKELHVLINNAGVMLPKMEYITKDGYDYQFGINALGHYFLTTLLLPTLLQTSSSPSSPPSRIVNVTSAGHVLTSAIDYSITTDNEKRRKTANLDLYNQSKFANVVFSSELAKRFGHLNLVSTAVHPGMINTNLGRDIPPLQMKIMSYINYPAPAGAITPLYAATAPETETANGKYFVAFARPAEPNPKTLDPKVGEELWTWFEEQVKNF